MKKKHILFICMALIFTNCATVFTGTKDKIYFHTEPKGADIVIKDSKVGETPSEIKVKRKVGTSEVTFKKKGYKPLTIKLEKQFTFVSIFDVIGLYGFVVDIATGAIVKYNKVYYDVELDPIDNNN